MPANVINPNDGDDLLASTITTNVTDRIVSWGASHETGATTNGAVRHTSDQIDDAALPELATPSSAAETSGSGVHARLDMFAVVLSGMMGSSGSGYAAKYAALASLTYGSLAVVNTALTTGASAAAGASTLVRRAVDGSANYSGTLGVVAISGTGNWATTGSVTSVDAVHSGVIRAGSGAHQITTAAGNLDATQLANALPAGSFPAMTGDVTSAGGSLATVVSAVGGKTAAQVGSVTTSVLAASSSGVGNHGAIAKYDVAGGMTFDAPVTAPSFVGPLSGNASSASTAGTAAALTAINPVAMGGTGLGAATLGSVLIGAGTSPLTSIAPGSANNVLISNGALWGSGPVVLNDYSVAATKIADGAILPEGGTTRVWVNAIKKWSSSGVAVHWDGGYFDLASYIAALGTSQRAYVLLELNDTAAIHPNPGLPVTGALADVNIPVKDPNTTALGLVVVSFGQTAIASADIVPWRGPGESGGGTGTGGGSPVGHDHSIAPEHRITLGGIDEGYPAPTVTPSMSILIYPIHYRSAAGIGDAISVATTKGGFAAPASGLRIYGVYFDPAIPGFVNTAPSDDPSAPTKPAFSGNQRQICYIHLRAASTVIKASDDGVNGWIEDVRTPLAGSGPTSLPIGVSDGGTGTPNFPTPGLVLANGTNPFTSVAATTSATTGLAIAPSTTPLTSDSVQLALGGGNVNMGSSSMTNSVAVDVLPGARVGTTGNAPNAYALRATGPTYGTVTNAAIYAKSGAAAGIAAIFDTVASPSGDINQYKANGTIVGRVTANGSMTAGGAHAAAATIHAVAQTTGTIGQIIDSPNGMAANLQSWRVNGVDLAHIGPGGGLTAVSVAAGVSGITSSGLATLSGGLTTSGTVTMNSGNLTVSAGTISVSGTVAASTLVSSGAAAGAQVQDRSGANYALMYRSGSSVFFFDTGTSVQPFNFNVLTGQVAQEAYTVPTLINSWAGFLTTPAYFKESTGVVRMRGGASAGAVSTVMFVTVAGYRPSSTRFFGGQNSGAVFMAFSVDTSGNATAQTSGVIFLDNGSYDIR